MAKKNQQPPTPSTNSPVAPPWAAKQENPQPPVTEGLPSDSLPPVEGDTPLTNLSEAATASEAEALPAASMVPPTIPTAPAIVTTPPAIGPVRKVEGEVVDMVTVTVPKGYKLRIDSHRELTVNAGVQQMERSLAEHWYSKANKVEIYNPKG